MTSLRSVSCQVPQPSTPNPKLRALALIGATPLLMLLCMTPVGLASTVNIYVSASGSGTTCTATAPCTLSQAQYNLEHMAGVGSSCTTPVAVNIILANNFYPNVSLNLTSADSGCGSGALVTWESTGTGHASLSGGIQVPSSSTGSSWTYNSTLGIWQIQVPNVNFEIAFFNHHRIYRPRLPVSGYYSIVSSYSANSNTNCPGANDYDSVNKLCTDRFSYTSGNFNQSWSNYNNEVEIIDFQRWTSSTARLSGWCNSSCDGNPTPVAIMTGTMAANTSGNLGFLTGHNYIIENVKEELASEQGTWYLARNPSDTTHDPYGDSTHYTLNYYPLPSDSFGSSSVIPVAQEPQVLVANGLSNTTFSGLYFGQDNFVVPSLGYAAVQSDAGSTIGGTVSAMVSCKQCANVVFTNDLFWETSGHGLEFVGAPSTVGNPNTQVTNSTFLDIGDIAVKLGAGATSSDTSANVSQYTLVQNNLMRSVARRFAAGGCVTLMISHNNTIEENECYDTYKAGITVGTVFGAYQQGCPFASQSCVGNNLVQNNLLL